MVFNEEAGEHPAVQRRSRYSWRSSQFPGKAVARITGGNLMNAFISQTRINSGSDGVNHTGIFKLSR
jgi:hypothetical protein